VGNQALQVAPKNSKEIAVYSIAKPEEVEEVAEFAEENYFNLSPVREMFSLDDATNEDTLAWRKGGFQRCFQHPTSIVVREKNTGRLVGFLAAVVKEKSEVSVETLVDTDDRSAGWLVRALLAELNKGVDLYALYQTDRILHLWRCGIRKDYQGQKLLGMSSPTFRALFAKIAHVNETSAIRAEGFSHYYAPEKCWQTIRTIHYETFQLPDGKRPFAGVDLGVHRTLRLLACRPPPLTPFNQQFYIE